MKNKKENCCEKMNAKNIFIGLLMGAAVLVFGWKMYLQQNPMAEPKILDSTVVDQMLENVKKGGETMDFSGTWSTEGENPAKLTLNADGTVTDMEGVTSWKMEGTTLTLTNADETTQTIELTDGNLVLGDTVYKK